MKKIILLITVCCFILLGSCKKEEPDVIDNPSEQKTITLVDNNVEPGQIVLAQVSQSFTLNPGANILLNGLTTAAFDAGDHKIGFIMPVLPVGKVEADYSAIGIQAKLEITIKEYSHISDPQSVLDDFSSALDKTVLNLEEQVNSSIVELDENYPEMIKYLSQTLKDNFKKLSEEEKTQVAYFLRSNILEPGKFKLDSLNEDLYLKKKHSHLDPGNELINTSLSLNSNLTKGIALVVGGLFLAKTPSPLLITQILAVGFLVNGYAYISAAVADGGRVGNLGGIAVKITEAQMKKQDPLDFTNNKEAKVSFKATFRNLNMSDQASANPVISGIFKSLGSLQAGYNQSVELANYVMGWFPWKTPKIPLYNNPIGSQSKTTTLILPGEKLSISEVSNTTISFESRKVDDGLYLKFNRQNLTNDLLFYFNVTFKDDALGIELKSQVDGILKTRSFVLLDESRALVVAPLNFQSGKARYFYLSDDFITVAAGIDYSKISYKNKSAGSSVNIDLSNNTNSFGLKLTHEEKEEQMITLEIYYDGKLVQTIVNLLPAFKNPWIDTIVGTWIYEEYIKLSETQYLANLKSRDDNIANNPCGWGNTPIGYDSILGNFTILKRAPNSSWDFVFYSGLTFDLVGTVPTSSVDCTPKKDTSIKGWDYSISTTGKLITGVSTHPLNGQLEVINASTLRIKSTGAYYMLRKK